MGLNESIPIKVRRRISDESLEEYVMKAKNEYSQPCDYFDDVYDYVDLVIDYGIDDFLAELEDIENDDDYSDIMDYLRSMCRNMFSQDLIDTYKKSCPEQENDWIIEKEETKEAELTEKCWSGYTQKGMKTMFGKRYPNCVKKTKK